MRRDDVDAGEFLHALRMIERQAIAHARAAVVAGHAELPEAEVFHHVDLVLPHAAKRGPVRIPPIDF